MSIFDFFKNKDNVIETADANDTIADVLTKMSQHNIGCMLITENEKLVGIFTERDLLRRWIEIYPLIFAKKPISEVMTKNPVTLDIKSADRASVFMTAHRFRHLPITDNGKLVDIFSIRDVVHLLMDETDRLNAEIKKLKQ